MSTVFLARFSALRDRDDGSTMSEYAILAALIAVALVAVIAALAVPLADIFTAAGEGLGEGS
jgi:Flp pilus assembly pilin Flp